VATEAMSCILKHFEGPRNSCLSMWEYEKYNDFRSRERQSNLILPLIQLS
jgi:hypothetical protein